MTDFQFLPIPTGQDHLRASAKHWLPFLPAIARRGHETIDEMLDQIAREEVQLGLVWDGEAMKARALIGMRAIKQGDHLIGELCWMAGKGMKQWRNLLPQAERYLKEHRGCDIIRPICRPGWARFLQQHGYKITHYMMERPL